MGSTLLNILSDETIFGLAVFNKEDFLKLLIRFIFNLSVITILIRIIYYRSAKRKDYLFAYFIVGSVVFLICFLLDNVKLQLGLALGLFAVFGIIRYRTAQIPIKEMTYLFLIIGMSVLNALANKKISYIEILMTNLFIILLTLVLEYKTNLSNLSRKTVLYGNMDLIKPRNKNKLLKDLIDRTGLNIVRADIGKLDLKKDVAQIKIYYVDYEGISDLTDEEPEAPDD